MLSVRIQVQAIADALRGMVDEAVPLQAFDEPFKTVYQQVRNAEHSTRHQVLFEVLADRKDKETLIAMITEAEPGFSLNFPSLAEIAPDLPPIEWLWEKWIPLGMISLLGAMPGAGKSFVALDLAKRITSGTTWPNDYPHGFEGRNVIYVDAEVVPQLINERATQWEMDTTRLYLMLPQEKLFIDFSDQRDRDYLADMAYYLNPALIVIDSLSSISLKGENNVEDVRGILGYLNQLAQDNVCGLLLIHHLRKRGMGFQPEMNLLTIDDFRGSSHIIAIARSVLGLSMVQTGPEPDKNGPRRLEIVKTNLAAYPESLGVTFQPMHPKGVRLAYGDKPSPYKEPRKVDRCKEWLIETLGDEGEMGFKDLKELATMEDFSQATVYRARKELGSRIVDTKGRRDPDNKWRLM